MGGRVVLVRARKLRPGMRLRWAPAAWHTQTRVDTIEEVRGGWVRVVSTQADDGWYWLWALLDRMRDGDLEVVR